MQDSVEGGVEEDIDDYGEREEEEGRREVDKEERKRESSAQDSALHP